MSGSVGGFDNDRVGVIDYIACDSQLRVNCEWACKKSLSNSAWLLDCL